MLAGKTVENVVELEILTPGGERFCVGPTSDAELADIVAGTDARAKIYRELQSIRDDYAALIRKEFPTIKRRVSGLNLDQLLPENQFNVARALVGSEGTCVTVLQARVSLIENPIYRRVVVLGFDDIFQAGDTVPDIMPFTPIAMEGLDWSIVGGLIDRKLRLDEVAMLPEGKAWLICELSADNDTALEQHSQRFEETMQATDTVRSVKAFTDAESTQKIWSIREQGASATSLSLHPGDPDPAVGWEDTAVDPLRLGDYLREFQALVDRYNYTTSLYGHFGDGCIHARITFDTRTQQGVNHWRGFSEEIAALVVKYGGSLSGEHGDGQAKAEFLPLMFSAELMQAFERFKRIWDPDNRMNPGKLIHPYRMDENLRFSPEYKQPAIATTLQFVEDPGGFARSTERCIGMGKCRAQQGAMCPSYQATGEERYSTRGRAHLLHELIRGDILRDGWQDEQIRDSLEHCLSCKACKSECPTRVDIASYKAEFMSKHYANKRRPIGHYLLGHTATLLRWGARSPAITNAMQRSFVGTKLKNILGMDSSRSLPALAAESFSSWASKQCDVSDNHFFWFGEAQVDAKSAILWADSFNASYRPELLQKAIAVLQKTGFRVGVARQAFCCGRPLYEQGMLDTAAAHLDKILDKFYPTLSDDQNVVVLEASCLSVFHDELLRLRADDPRAQQLSQRSMTLASFLSQKNIAPQTRLEKGVLHLHCHHKAIEQHATDRQWMKACFEELLEPEAGCCGMAGSFGLRTKTRAIAQSLFARQLKPTIDASGTDTVLVSNGFSCREQMEHNSQRQVLHPVEVILQCL